MFISLISMRILQYFLRADIKFSPVDEALRHHVQRSGIKAKHRALGTVKRKTHAETPQAEADVERHAYLGSPDLKRKAEPFFKSAKKLKKHYDSGARVYSNTFSELILSSVLLMRPCVIMCKDLESKPKTGLWVLLKERPMLKLHRQKLMLRDILPW
ncbi:hypothetical protein PoB_004407800 [Plakobranchus ocellatus]|uniref:Uncharacterized protein n=1 Tax=Plakobranchus ocellatus TaxID=259542 RepID=A0AAV4BDD8_9GAST|nr:hypothetical protein PoB_004407800 [Plakobranchus ocellatus]